MAGVRTLAVHLAERGWLPDAAVRLGIRAMLRDRLREERAGDPETQQAALEAFVSELRASPIALVPDRANEQHYEMPPGFFRLVLGRRLKYSCALWEPGVADLDAAEEAMLRRTAERAQLRDGMNVLDLGCGWGSLALWTAERHPASHVTAVSNSKLQRELVLAECRRRGLENVDVVTADMNDFDPGRRFDRVVSVEMFEHMRNWEALLGRIAGWLEPDGRLFVHVFCHRERAYPYEDRGPGDWMAREFFSGGMMPSAGLLARFQRHLVLERQWAVGGQHYTRTCEAWLERLDRRRTDVLELFREACGSGEARRWLHRWRLFFLACAGLFAYRNGTEWFVSHYRMAPRAGRPD